jgi:hypothetical protein
MRVRQVFFNFHTLKEHAEQIAQMRARFGNDFIEGYGYIMQNGQVPLPCALTETSMPNRNINIIDEYSDYDVEVVEIKENDSDES